VFRKHIHPATRTFLNSHSLYLPSKSFLFTTEGLITCPLLYLPKSTKTGTSLTNNYLCGTVPWLKWLVASLSPRRPGFDPGSVHVGFVVDKWHWDRFSPRVLRFYPVNFIPPVLSYKDKRKNYHLHHTVAQ
jgi:hypothetical protein